MSKLSILDIVPIAEGSSPADALDRSRKLARKAEEWGYTRYWVAEHHNMPGVASAATAVVIGSIAAATDRIRVGAGGIMLPNHAPLVVAEQFGTLESLFPGRIDLGLGRAPGTDPLTARALRRDNGRAIEFADEVAELQHYFAEPRAGQSVRAVPGAGLSVPCWILGSSHASGHVAGSLGLPYAYASHFAPHGLMDALAVYRDSFVPSAQLGAPYAMLGVNVVVADTQGRADHLFSSVRRRFLDILRRQPRTLSPPTDELSSMCTAAEEEQISQMLSCSFIGPPSKVREKLQAFTEVTQADELIVSATLYDAQDRQRSYELLAELWFH